MKLDNVQFVNTVSFGGQLQSASIRAVGDRPGQGGMTIEIDEKMRFIALTKSVNGITKTRLVPMTNVASFECIIEEPVKPAAAKK
jgi:hypothetical protein